MAKSTMIRSNQPKLNALCALGLFSLLVLVQNGGAYEFKVGGPNGWTIPPDSDALKQWAEKSRFQIGDTLLFVYPADKDVLLQVTKDDYANCHTATPIANYTDGHTVFKFDHSGPFYFISGVKEHCLKNEKLVVVVMADRTINKSNTYPPSNETTTAPSPPPSGSTDQTPPSPSPSPTAEEYPSPPSGSVEINPSPAPSADQTPPPSGATSIVVGFMGSIGAFVGSSLLLVL